MKKVITRIKGGLGNQIFSYAAARRLALENGAELVIDDVSGFVRDHQYRRRYALGHFHITARKATPWERLEPFDRYRRGLMKWVSRRQPFAQRRYLEQEGIGFDERLLDFKVNGVLYLDGYWQSEGYFKDVEQIIRDDLRIIPPTDTKNRHMTEEIRNSRAVALHVRWFDSPDGTESFNVSAGYYQRAIKTMAEKIEAPRYFLFSDNPDAARTKLSLPDDQCTIVSHNRIDDAYADLWLMTQCRHFIIANSTFSWWGAWLAGSDDKIVISPKLKIEEGKTTAWNFTGQIPNCWLKL